MLEYFAQYWGNRDTAVIIHISSVAKLVFHNGDDGSLLELSLTMSGHVAMPKHVIEKLLNAVKERKRCIEEMLSIE